MNIVNITTSKYFIMIIIYKNKFMPECISTFKYTTYWIHLASTLETSCYARRYILVRGRYYYHRALYRDVIGPRNGVRRVSSANKFRRDASRACTARIARVYLHRNGTRKGLYILLDVSSGRERRDEDGCELIKQNSRTISLGFSKSNLLFQRERWYPVAIINERLRQSI